MSSVTTARSSASRRSRIAGVIPAVLAALVTAVVFSGAQALAGREPFGSRSRLTNDLGGQFVPFHAALRDLLTGSAPGDLLFSWTSGVGVPFLPDYATYVASPLALLTLLFPRDHVDLAVFVITVLKLAAAAAMMTTFLRALRPAGPRWLAALAGVAYGTCGWAVDDGSYVPMWLDGFVGLPVLAIVTVWAREQRRLILGAVLVGLVWWANYYTAWMASIGAALLLLAQVGGEERSLRRALVACVRFAVQGVLGVALSAVILLPTLKAVRLAQPAASGVYVHHAWTEFATRLMPGSEGVGYSPSITVGSVTLLLASCLSFRSAVSARVRVVWSAVLVALVLSAQVPFTQSAWHGFAVPNGSPFREAFVICGVLVVLAWITVADGFPSFLELLGGAAVVAVVAAGARRNVTPGRTFLDPWSLRVLALVVALSLVLLVVARIRPRATTAASLALIALLAAEATWTATVIDRKRDVVLGTTPSWRTFASKEISAAQAARSEWPPFRFASTDGTSGNDPATVGTPGVDYYSSTMPAATTAMFVGLGARWAGYGRAVRLRDDDVALGAALSVRTAYSAARGAVSRPAMPLVRVVPTPGARTSSPGDVFAARRLALGPDVYALPPTDAPTRLNGARAPTSLRATCPAGTTAQLYLPNAVGAVSADGVSSGGRRLLNGRDGVITLGTTPGAVTVTVTSDVPARTVPHPIGCLDTAALERATRAAATSAPTIHASGHGVSATWPSAQHGTAVVATARSASWTCSVDGRPAHASTLAGLLAVDVDGARSIDCGYHPPGLTAGAAVSVGALCALVALGAAGPMLRRGARRRGATRSAHTA